MIAALTNHLWQSTLFVLAAALVAAALRKNGAHVRHRIWVVASLKFLVPFSILMSLGGALPRLTPTASAIATPTAPDLSVAVDRLAQPFTSDVFTSSMPAMTAPATDWTTVAIVGAWACGFAVIALMRLRDWRRIHATVRASALVDPEHVFRLRSADRSSVRGAADRHPGPPYAGITVRSAPGLLEPGVVGLWQPVLLVPAGIERHLTRPQLEAVLAHELCHVQRRDNLTSAIHMVVEAAFWFHPLVWFVGARLVEERERACDEHVLRVCGEPRIYAESILNVCKRYVESPIACVSGVSGADLKKRIAAIVSNRIGLQLTFARKAALALAAALAVVLPLVMGMLIASARTSASSAEAASAFAGASSDRPADTSEGHVASVSAKVRIAAAQTVAGVGAQLSPEPKAAPDQKFDLVSIKPCSRDLTPPPGRGGGWPKRAQVSPDSARWECLTVHDLVFLAYASPTTSNRLVNYRPARRDDDPQPVRGGPSWASSDRFTIEAKAAATVDQNALTGPMLRALLEDRFQLRTRRATEDRLVYVLTVTKGGLNTAKVKPTAPGDCVTRGPGAPLPPRPSGYPCGGQDFGPADGGAHKVRWTGTTLKDFLNANNGLMDRFVVDRTGVDGQFNIEFVFGPDEHTPGFPWPDEVITGAGPTVFKALEGIGLHLEPSKAPAEFVQIDTVQKPKPDTPDALPPSRARASGGVR